MNSSKLQKLTFWLFRVNNEAMVDKEFPETILEETVLCIPITGKERNTLKNW